MRALLLGFAASAVVVIAAAPAQAEHWSDPSFIAAASVAVHRGPTGGRGDMVAPSAGSGEFRWHRGGSHDGRRHRRDRDDDSDFVGWYYSRDFDGNRSFDPDKFNDWWHERTWRSYPRWTQNNQNCERQYWTGAGWRC